MEWFSWLTKTGLDPSLAYDYALTFAHNQLEEGDIAYFSHELLQSMGISVAKHRLEIIKLARKERGGRMYPILWFNFAFQKTKAYLANIKKTRKYMTKGQGGKSDLTVMPQRNQSLRWKVAMLQRSKILKAAKPEWLVLQDACPREEPEHNILMLTNGSPGMDNSPSSSSSRSSSSEETSANYELANPSNSSFSSTVIQSADGGEYWSSSGEEIKWDSMFQNLKPT